MPESVHSHQQVADINDSSPTADVCILEPFCLPRYDTTQLPAFTGDASLRKLGAFKGLDERWLVGDQLKDVADGAW